MSIREVAMYRAECDVCSEGVEGEFYAWTDRDSAVADVEAFDWFTASGRLVCPDCMKCEVCGGRGYPDDDHLVCEDHEGHDFTKAQS